MLIGIFIFIAKPSNTSSTPPKRPVFNLSSESGSSIGSNSSGKASEGVDGEKETERNRETERDRDRERQRQTERQTETERQRERDRDRQKLEQ